MTLYFNPPAVLTEGDRGVFGGRWEDRLWLNVPGPFYGAMTDNHWTGRTLAPAQVLYGGEYFTE